MVTFALNDFLEIVRFLERSPVTIVILIDLGVEVLGRSGILLWKFSLELY